MEKGYTPETREKYRIKLIDFLKKNPKATHSQIRKETKINSNQIIKKSKRGVDKTPLLCYYD